MPLFGSRNRNDYAEEPAPPPATHVDDGASRKGSLFSRRHRSTSPPRANYDNSHNGHTDDTAVHNGSKSGGFFSRRRSRSSSDDSMSTGRGSARTGSMAGGRNGNRLHNSKFSNDPVIMSARQKVTDAEDAERQADRALVEARAAVREAKQHVNGLERQMEEEARLAKMRQQEARNVSKSARGLGRHG